MMSSAYAAPHKKGRSTGRRTLAIALVLLLALAILSLVGLVAHQRFQTRGMARGLPGPIRHAAYSPYGLNVALLDWEAGARETALAQIAAAGFCWIRQPISWGEADGFDSLLEAANRHGLTVLPLLDGDPDDSFAPPADLTEWAEWVGGFAARHGDGILAYQIWDEPNLTSHWGMEPVNPAGYAALLAAAYDAIRAADPDAIIVAAALAPTVETGPANLSDLAYLESLYDLGADDYFDVAAGKPYGFDTGPRDRRVAPDEFNFSRLILLREVMERHGDAETALWAGNFGWNALPLGWTGRPSIWGQTDLATQAAYTQAAFQRASDEWPWSGVLFLESYSPAAPPDDPRWGFALLSTSGEPRSPLLTGRLPDPIPAFQVPDPDALTQQYSGGWRFQAEYGADISQTGDSVQVTFTGTDFGLLVRRGDYRAYLFVTVDGQPANALPVAEQGAYLNLTSPDGRGDDLALIPVARHLAPGRHTAEIVAERGWGQWALVGFSAANLPDGRLFRRAVVVLSVAALGLTAAAVAVGRRAEWGRWGERVHRLFGRLGKVGQALLTAAMAALFAISGWLTWLVPGPTGGPFRRLGEDSQAFLLVCVAGLFYLSPWLLLTIASGLALLVLICWRLDLGLALVALSAPFYVYPKPMLGYRFSMVELVMLMVLAAWGVRLLVDGRRARSSYESPHVGLRRWVRSLSALDWAVASFVLVALLSLLFTERLDVATNELRVVVLEPALFYLVLRTSRLSRSAVWRVVDGFVLGGVLVALLGLGWYVMGEHVITAEGGLPRLRSIYGSPNNVGLYLGRVIPVALGVTLWGRSLSRGSLQYRGSYRRWLYGFALLPLLAAVALSFSKGALLFGLPAGVVLVVVLGLVESTRGRPRLRRAGLIALVGVIVLVIAAVLVASRIPALAGRLSLAGQTTDFRVSLWQASLSLIKEHPWTGVGLDNFLYAYRGRYLRPEAWQEPDLSHPHNLILDYWTRLGILGLAAGLAIQVAFWRLALRALKRAPAAGFRYSPALLVGLMGSMAATLAHGLVDQSYFLIDLAYAFMLAAGLVAKGVSEWKNGSVPPSH